ncbi:hypothetical protein FOL47_007618 [Perkinsus chesapeaki]|uniref:subtilisin n=1 Tax=Perkinsus chesapeaki TaxID=330153 RepID=A0A7J6LJ86_PERCH|nr:hypothetical protein FOL47_007618 [Perkinsus chesapeaki]
MEEVSRRPSPFIIHPLQVQDLRTAGSAEEGLPYTGNSPPVNDPLYVKQAAYMEAIGVPGAWRRLKSTKLKRHRITVAHVDSGVKRDHPDLMGQIVEGYNVVKDDNDTDDVIGHGTLDAGVFGATINNSIGLSGVMDLVSIMPVSVEDKFTDVNMGKLREADEAGLLMITTAGNTGSNTTIDQRFPCNLTQQLSGMICVAATEQINMRLSKGSSFANFVDIAAPGVKIVTTTNDAGYTRYKGTCPASAFIVGVAAMLYSLNPALSSSQVKKILKDTAKKGLKDATGAATLPFGRVDADAAVAKLIP